MSQPHPEQIKNTRPKTSAHRLLFKPAFPSPKNVQFQHIFYKLNIDTQQATKKCFTKATHKNNPKTRQAHQNSPLQVQNYHVQGLINKKAADAASPGKAIQDLQGKRLRAFSSTKFDCLIKKKPAKRSKMFTQNPMEHVKLTEGSSNSKKSTDNSNSSEIERIRTENQLISQSIQAEQRRIKLLQKLISEESKRHQSQKQLYRLNIDKLMRKTCGYQDPILREIGSIRESFLSKNEEQSECDSPSLDSR